VPESLKHPLQVAVELGIAAMVAFHRGDVTAARGHLSAAVPHAQRIGHLLIPTLTLARGLDPEQAGDLPGALSVLAGWLGGSTAEFGPADELTADAVRVAVRAGDLDAARAIAAYAHVRYGRSGRSLYPGTGRALKGRGWSSASSPVGSVPMVGSWFGRGSNVANRNAVSAQSVGESAEPGVPAGTNWLLPRKWLIISSRVRGRGVMSVSAEERRIRNLFERAETIEEVAVTLPEGDDRRARLLAVSRDALAEEATVRPVIAARRRGGPPPAGRHGRHVAHIVLCVCQLKLPRRGAHDSNKLIRDRVPQIIEADGHPGP